MTQAVQNADGVVKLTRKDFQSGLEVKWCPGCADHAVLTTVQRVMPELGIPKEKIVFVSGIGCSSRFPYYMATYGMHTIHGRALPIATGLKMARPDLSVWVATGDGDALSIGGNHFVHAIRRNVDLKILLFDNRIYGLTKGQTSPTSPLGMKTKSTPLGSIDKPVNPMSLALGAGATFVARAIATDPQQVAMVLERAARHKGTALVELWQNCPIFNDGAWDHWSAKETRAEVQVRLEHGKPLTFGAKGDKALRIGKGLHIVEGAAGEGALIHDETDLNLAMALAELPMDMPQAFGVLRAVSEPTVDEMARKQEEEAAQLPGPSTLAALLASGDTWTV